MPEQTLPQFLVRNAREFPQDPALREKDRGIWQQWTWAEYLAHVRSIALGLVSLGFERGDKLGSWSSSSTTRMRPSCMPRTRSRWTSSSISETSCPRSGR